jgi:hypothetical protein
MGGSSRVCEWSYELPWNGTILCDVTHLAEMSLPTVSGVAY